MQGAGPRSCACAARKLKKGQKQRRTRQDFLEGREAQGLAVAKLLRTRRQHGVVAALRFLPPVLGQSLDQVQELGLRQNCAIAPLRFRV